MEQINFCNKDSHLAEVIPNLICEHIFVSELKDAIRNRYEDMRVNFNNPADAAAWGIKGKEYSNKLYDYSINMDIPHEKCRYEQLADKGNIGVDLPTWIDFREGKKKLMIISQDPLRSDYANYLGRIIVSSPFGLQNSDYRRKASCKRYLTLFDLLTQNYSLYLTDFRKIYVGEDSKGYSEKEAEKNDAMIKEEIRVVNPDVIITMSKDAFIGITDGVDINMAQVNVLEDLFTDKYHKKPVLPLVHLSWAAAKSQNEFKKNNNFQSGETLQSFYSRLINFFIEGIS